MVRKLHPGMGEAVAQRTVLRYFLSEQELKRLGNPREISINPGEEKSNYRKWNAAALNSGLNVTIDASAPIRGCAPDIRYETWGDVAKRVAEGNSSLCKSDDEASAEYKELYKHISSGVALMSGRHLQHRRR